MRHLVRAALLLALLALLSAGCSASGSGSGTKVAQGDPTATVGAATLDFPAAGAPFDAFVQFVDVLEAIATLDLGLARELAALVLYLYTPRDLLQDTHVEYDLTGWVLQPAKDEVSFNLPFALNENAAGDLVAADDSHVTISVPDARYTLESLLTRSGRFGFGFANVHVGMMRDLLGDGTANFAVNVDTDASSDYQADHVHILIGGNIIEDLGPVHPGMEDHLSTTVHVSELTPVVEVQFLTVTDAFYRDVGIDFRFSLPDLSPRVASVGSMNEGVGAVPQGMMLEDFPGETLDPGDFGIVVAGRHGVEVGKFTPMGYESFVAHPQPVDAADTTYRATLVGVLPGGGYLRGAGAARLAATPPVVAALVAVGSYGISIANYDNGAGAFGSDTVPETGNMTDLSPFDGDPASGQAVYVDNSADAIKFVKRDAMDQYVIDPAATLTNAAWPMASGAVVSAFRHASGDLLFVTDGTPGELWVLPAGATTATKVGPAGDSPRNVRAAGNIAAVGAYGTGIGFGGLSLYVRGAGGAWSAAPFSLLGPRAVGIDVMQIPGGRVAVACPAYLSNQLRLVIVDGANGGILDDQAIDLPAGCTNPGHAAFVRDAGFEAVLVSCNTSDNVALIPVSWDG